MQRRNKSPIRRGRFPPISGRRQSLQWDSFPRPQVSRYSILCPDQMFVQLEYTDTVALSAAFADQRTYAFNDLYDPNVTGVGAQPVGFDQWSSLYGRYFVTGCRFTTELHNLSAAVPVIIVAYPSTDATALTATADAAGQPYARTLTASGTSGIAYARFTHNHSTTKIVGRDITSINFTGAAAASPANRVYHQIVIGSADGSTNYNIILRVRMVFKVRFYQKIALARS